MKRSSAQRIRAADSGRNNEPVPVLRVKKGASLKTIYAAARRAFTATDLQKFTEMDEGIPADQVLSELEEIDREDKQRRKRKSRA